MRASLSVVQRTDSAASQSLIEIVADTQAVTLQVMYPRSCGTETVSNRYYGRNTCSVPSPPRDRYGRMEIPSSLAF